MYMVLGTALKSLKRSGSPPLPLCFWLLPSPWIVVLGPWTAVLGAGGGWARCGARGDPLPEAWLDAPQGGRALRSSQGWAEGWNCVLSSFLSGSYLLWALRRGWVWFGLRVDLDGSAWSVLFSNVQAGFFVRICLL